MTTFDEVYEYFNDISQGIDSYYLPSYIDEQKRLISNGRRLFNNKLFTNVQQDNLTETFDKVLSENDNEYFELFQSSGWEHMCSYGAFHFF